MAFECPIKAAVVCQPPSKFGMFTFFVSYTMPFILFFFFKLKRKQDFWIFGRRTQNKFSKEEGGEPPLDEAVL